MDIVIKDKNNADTGKKKLPAVFAESIRPDLIKRAVLAIQSNKRQPYGADPMAGKRHSTKNSKRRRAYRGTYGMGGSRVPRKILNRRGRRLYYVGAFMPGTVGGRRAHPPKAEKIWEQKINTKERRKAIRSALAATMVSEQVKQRGHVVPEAYPFIIENSIKDIKTTSELKKVLEKLGFKDELARCENRTIRAGKGKMRGRKYVTKTGPLLVVSEKCDLFKAASNLPGVEVALVNELNAESLAPGTYAGRLTLFTEDAIEKLQSENHYTGMDSKSKKTAQIKS